MNTELICNARDPVTGLKCGLYAWHKPSPHRLLRFDHPYNSQVQAPGRIEWDAHHRWRVVRGGITKLKSIAAIVGEEQ